MSQNEACNQPEIDDSIADSDTRVRKRKGAFCGWIFLAVPLVWAIYRLWIASPLRYDVALP